MTGQKTDNWESKFLLLALPALIAVTVVFFWPVFSGWLAPAAPVHKAVKRRSGGRTSAVERQVKALSLLGVVVDPTNPHATSAQAILRNQHGQAKNYHLNDKIVGDYRLTAVYPSSVRVGNSKGTVFPINLPPKSHF